MKLPTNRQFDIAENNTQLEQSQGVFPGIMAVEEWEEIRITIDELRGEVEHHTGVIGFVNYLQNIAIVDPTYLPDYVFTDEMRQHIKTALNTLSPAMRDITVANLCILYQNQPGDWGYSLEKWQEARLEAESELHQIDILTFQGAQAFRRLALLRVLNPNSELGDALIESEWRDIMRLDKQNGTLERFATAACIKILSPAHFAQLDLKRYGLDFSVESLASQLRNDHLQSSLFLQARQLLDMLADFAVIQANNIDLSLPRLGLQPGSASEVAKPLIPTLNY